MVVLKIYIMNTYKMLNNKYKFKNKSGHESEKRTKMIFMETKISLFIHNINSVNIFTKCYKIL